MRNVVIIVLALLAASCGSRKVNKTEVRSSEKVETEITAAAVEHANVVVKSDQVTVLDVVSGEENLVPIDPARPIVKTETVEGNTRITTWQNAQVNSKRSEDRSKVEQSSAVTDLSVKTSDIQYKVDEEKESVAVEKKTAVKRGFSWWWLLLLVVPAGWWLRKRYLVG